MEPPLDNPAALLRQHLSRLRALRGAPKVPAFEARVTQLRGWQAERLARTYADLSADARYAPATRFFLEDLYGTKDYSGRDADLQRVLPVMTRVLPQSAIETAALAIEVDALSEELDRGMAGALEPGEITAERYAKAYRRTGTRAQRAHQINLIGQVGRRLDALVKRPLVYRMLQMMRRPAKLAGLADLQGFLERGFESFEHMRGADHFLTTIAERETEIMERIFSGRPALSSR
jgi:hypothetical protein